MINIIDTKKFIFFIFIIIMILPNVVSGCTGFTAYQNDIVLIGNNEDYWYPDPMIRIFPPENGNNGYIVFEGRYPLPWNSNYSPPGGGINDKGLFFDCFSTPWLKVSFKFFKPPLFKNPLTYVMEKFSRVDEVVEYFESHNLFFLTFIGLNTNQVFFADRTGDSVIIEGDDIIYRTGNFQVVTNFLQSHPEIGNYSRDRYDKAVEMLENMRNISIDYFKNICNATHSESYSWPTQYSYISNLNTNLIYIYHFFNYEKVIILNLTEEFKLGKHSYHLPSLFEPINNSSPYFIRIDGPINVKQDEENNYFVRAADQDNDRIYYLFDWGDGATSQWISTNSYGTGLGSHSWKKSGEYHIRVKLRDIYGAESEWCNAITVSVERDISIYKFSMNFIIPVLTIFASGIFFKVILKKEIYK